MFYNTLNHFRMGEYVVSGILMLNTLAIKFFGSIKFVKPSMFDATVIIAGITIVVGVLLLLIYIFELFGKLVPKIEKASNDRAQKRAAKKAAKKAKKADKESGNAKPEPKQIPAINNSAPQQASPVVEQGISGEIVAAITAAIVASEGSNVVVRSIRKKTVSSRNPWAHAANIDNTRPF